MTREIKTGLSDRLIAFNSAMCKIYKVKLQQLDDIYKYTCQLDIADAIMHRHRNFLCNLWHSPNAIVRHLASVEL